MKALRDRVHLVFSVECEGGNAVVSHLDELRLMLFFRSLKADFATAAMKGMAFSSFREEKIFLKRFLVIPHRRWCEVLNECIAHPIVEEVDFLVVFELS